MASQVQPSESIEWVYLAESDEPTVFETETPKQTHPQYNEAVETFFNSQRAAEQPSSESTPEGEYFGDDEQDEHDIIDDRIPPEKAFETFLGRNFPTQHQPYDYSTSLYSKTNTVPPSNKHRHSVRLQHVESKSERLARLTAEVEQLSVDSGLSADQPATDAFNQLKQLRAQLHTIEQNASYIPPPFIPTTQDQDDDKPSHAQLSSSPVMPQPISPNFDTISLLERRLSTLENSIGVAQLENSFDGTSITSLVEDVRARLCMLTDESLPDRLKDDAKQIAQVLRSDLQTDRGEDALRTATLLDKMQEWQPLVDTLPILIDRLSSVRHLHQEADHFVAAMQSITKQVDNLESRHNTNDKLLQTVQQSLQINIKSVNDNIDLLKSRLDVTDKSNSSEPT